MSNRLSSVVVVGASLAGLQAAQTLRRSGFDGDLTLVGSEPHYPYDRPPLSKRFLAGTWDEAKLRLRGAVDPDEFQFNWKLGHKATGLDLEQRQVILGDDGQETLSYDGLVIATGARPRTIDGCELTGVHVLRTLDHARALRSDLEGQSRRVCVIGAGFIGAEVAATARELGHEVTMIEAAQSPLARVLDHETGMAIADLHRDHGVDVRLGVGVAKIEGGVAGGQDGDDNGGDTAQSGGVERVVLSDGSAIESDVVVVGIGVVPSTEWLARSGLTLDNGVVCDDTCMAAPGVVAAGDVARWPNSRFEGKLMRVEQWDNAVEQGGYVGGRLLAWSRDDAVEPYAPTPWFWSDQYDRKIQLAGFPSARAEVVHGSIPERRFVQLYAGERGELIGAMAWNRPRHAIKAKQLIARGANMSEAREELS